MCIEKYKYKWVNYRSMKEIQNMHMQKIDCDLIRSLRYQGKIEEANELLNQMHENNKKNREEERKEIISKNFKIHKVVKTSMGLCVVGNCENKALPGKITCEEHSYLGYFSLS